MQLCKAKARPRRKPLLFVFCFPYASPPRWPELETLVLISSAGQFAQNTGRLARPKSLPIATT